jgi:XTP/dITP diphosphohydrolase
MRDLVIATSNSHKIAEIQAVLGPLLGVTLPGLADLGMPLPPEPEEDGETFEANAIIKARAYAAHTKRPCLADDSGLVVDALGGAPGVHSSRYAHDVFPPKPTQAARDAANNGKLLAALQAVPIALRTARFICVMVIAEPDGTIRHVARGAFEGRIGLPTRVPAGRNGFGYDPLFLTGPDHAHTSAELAPDQKNAVSHRGAALRSLADMLDVI